MPKVDQWNPPLTFCHLIVLDEFPDISSCVHFAGLKAVGESVSKPLLYYDCNIGGTVNLLEQLGSRGIKKFVFSSSATVYGEPEMLPLVESARLQATNPYGRTKLFIEEILRDCHAADPSWNVLILRVSLLKCLSFLVVGFEPTIILVFLAISVF